MPEKKEHVAQPERPAAIVQRLAPRLAEREPDLDARGIFAAENIDDLRLSGLMLLNVPDSHGGLGSDLSETVETLRLIAQSSPSTALMLAMHTSTLAHYLIADSLVPAGLRDGFQQQRAWAFKQAREGKIFAVANSEPGAGGDLQNSKALVRGESSPVLTGTKSFSSFGLNANYFMAAARGENDRVEYFLVQNDPAHVHVAAPWAAMGMRSSESVVLRFDSAPVVGMLAYPGLLDGLNHRHWSTLSFTAIFVGIAESLLDDLVARSVSSLQKVESVEMRLTIEACRSFLRYCVSIEPEPADEEYRRLVRDCKLFVTRSLARQAAAAFSTQTGAAYSFSSPISRKFRDLLAGPPLRPPVGLTFDELWDEMKG